MAQKFQFHHLERLVNDMKKNGKVNEDFVIKFQNHLFKCVLDINRLPFKFAIANTKEGKSLAIILEVDINFETIMSKEDYSKLCKFLNLSWSVDKFCSAYFLKTVDDQIPPKCSPIVTPTSVLMKVGLLKKEEGEAIIFAGWLPHAGRNNGNVTLANLEKCERLLGYKAKRFSQETNTSTKWTTDPANEKTLNLLLLQ